MQLSKIMQYYRNIVVSLLLLLCFAVCDKQVFERKDITVTDTGVTKTEIDLPINKRASTLGYLPSSFLQTSTAGSSWS